MKTVLITGASGGLGTFVTAEFRRAGWKVLTVQSPRSGSADASAYAADLTRETDVVKLIDRLRIDGHRPDALMLLTGGFEAGALDGSTGSSVQRMLDLNFFTAYHLIHGLVRNTFPGTEPLQIVCIGARVAGNAKIAKDLLAYSISKSVLASLVEYLQSEDRRLNIRATMLLPGTIDTPANRSFQPDADRSGWSKPGEMAVLMRRLAEGDDGVDWKAFLEC